jgi:hypothetical protein
MPKLFFSLLWLVGVLCVGATGGMSAGDYVEQVHYAPPSASDFSLSLILLGYNRPLSLQRLFQSLMQLEIPTFDNGEKLRGALQCVVLCDVSINT